MRRWRSALHYFLRLLRRLPKPSPHRGGSLTSYPGLSTGDQKTMNKFTIILKLFPVVLGAVKAVEEAVPLPGQGQKKLDAVLNVVEQAYEGSAELSQSFSWDKLVAVVVPMIGSIVGLHNDLGLFAKASPAKA
jgi:hypothetical protein